MVWYRRRRSTLLCTEEEGAWTGEVSRLAEEGPPKLLRLNEPEECPWLGRS